MELKHDWAPEHARIIQGLKKLLASNGFLLSAKESYDHTDEDYLYFQQGIFAQMRSSGEEKDLVRTWELLLNSAYLSSRHSKKERYALYRLMLVQSLIYLFSRDRNIDSTERYNDLCDFMLNDETEISCTKASWKHWDKAREWQNTNNAPWICVDSLPVRLQPDFMECLRQKDFAKLVFMLDFLSNPGEKPKNICNHLLNIGEYGSLFLFGDPAVNLAKTNPAHLKCFWLNCLDRTGEEMAFSRTVYPLLDFRAPWQELHSAKRLSYKLNIMLDNGISPNCNVYAANGVHIPLKKYLLFLDEIRELLKTAADSIFTIRDDLAASESYLKRISLQ